ncbi:cytochrome P450 [Streptomyces sp. NPDC001970]
MTQTAFLRQISDYAVRANPYPLYAELRKTPVTYEGDNTYIVSTYWEVWNLLHDPRISSDSRNIDSPTADALAEPAEESPLPPNFLHLDPPEHDRFRRITNRPFGPPHSPHRINGMRGEMREMISGIIDAIGSTDRIDLVDQVAYPLPVTVICRLLGVPTEDEARFHQWADAIVAGLDMNPDADRAELMRRVHRARLEMGTFLNNLIEARRNNPGDDMLSQLATSHGPDGAMTTPELMSTAVLLLIAGHETTVNLITNGMLTLLRHPEALQRLRSDPDLVVPMVEELLRYEPPVHFVVPRATLADIEIGGVGIPRGATVYLAVAAANRDPERFPDPDTFIPDREDNQHLGFGSGIHSCFGAPLARLETQLALTALAHRLDNPRLLEDPPPYRRNVTLRGPRHLPIACDAIRPQAPAGTGRERTQGLS